ncbi:MAG: ImmA/IrrE family metallo-endopeptidase [Gammaproteobacteria bacterium]
MAPSDERFSPIEISLCRRWRARHPVVAIQNAIKAAFPDLEQIRPPIDPYVLAKRRGIDVRIREIEADGFISQTSNGDYIVELNVADPETRRRFTLAHEIAHTFFFDLLQTEGNRYRSADCPDVSFHRDLSEEYLCNVAASEMLMPSPQFLVGLDKFGPTALAVVRLASEYQTSLQAAAWRISWLVPYKIITCYWQYERTPGTYKTLWTTPLNTSKNSRVQQYCVDKSQPAYQRFSEGKTFRGWTWISLAGPVERHFVDGILLHKEPRRLITVIVLEAAAERIFAPYPLGGKHSRSI